MKKMLHAYILCLRTAPFGVSIALILHTINMCALAVVLPVGQYTRDGNPISRKELWMSGGGELILGYGLVSLMIVVGLLKRKPWSKIMVCLWFVVIVVWNLVNGYEVEAVAIGIVACFYILYFYFNTSAKEYFKGI